MIRQELLVLILTVAGLSGCCLSASHQTGGCNPCGATHDSVCGTPCSHGKTKCGCSKGMSCGKTSPLFPGDNYGQVSHGGCSTCGESMASMPATMMGSMPEPANSGCGCGEQSSSMMPVQQFPAHFAAPSGSLHQTPPTNNTQAPAVPPEQGMPPKPKETSEESEPTFPINVEPGNEGAPAAEPVVDPISWEIPTSR